MTGDGTRHLSLYTSAPRRKTNELSQEVLTCSPSLHWTCLELRLTLISGFPLLKLKIQRHANIVENSVTATSSTWKFWIFYLTCAIAYPLALQGLILVLRTATRMFYPKLFHVGLLRAQKKCTERVKRNWCCVYGEGEYNNFGLSRTPSAVSFHIPLRCAIYFINSLDKPKFLQVNTTSCMFDR